MKRSKMGRLMGLGAAIAVCAGTSLSALGAITFSGSQGNLSASVTFDTYKSGGIDYLTVLLKNTSTADVMAPGDVLTAVFWDPTANLTPLKAVLGTGSTVLFAPAGGAGPVVGGEWAYKAGLSGTPGNAVLGISSSGLNWFGPSDLFPGSNLQGPVEPDGVQYGITSAGDDPTTGNAKVTGSQALIQNSVLFALQITGTYNLADIKNVNFQYGTSASETHFSAVPEPTTMIAGALLLLPFGASTVRILRRNKQVE